MQPPWLVQESSHSLAWTKTSSCNAGLHVEESDAQSSSCQWMLLHLQVFKASMIRWACNQGPEFLQHMLWVTMTNSGYRIRFNTSSESVKLKRCHYLFPTLCFYNSRILLSTYLHFSSVVSCLLLSRLFPPLKNKDLIYSVNDLCWGAQQDRHKQMFVIAFHFTFPLF